MRRIRLVLPYPPSINRWKDPGSGHAYLTAEVRRYKAAADSLLRRHLGRVGLLERDVRLKMDLFRPTRAGDISNRIKVLEDCLRGLIFRDDVQVAELHVRRFEDAHAPRVQVTVEEVDPAAFLFETPEPAMLRDASEVGRLLTAARRAETRRTKERAALRPGELRTLATPATYPRRKPL